MRERRSLSTGKRAPVTEAMPRECWLSPSHAGRCCFITLDQQNIGEMSSILEFWCYGESSRMLQFAKASWESPPKTLIQPGGHHGVKANEEPAFIFIAWYPAPGLQAFRGLVIIAWLWAGSKAKVAPSRQGPIFISYYTIHLITLFLFIDNSWVSWSDLLNFVPVQVEESVLAIPHHPAGDPHTASPYSKESPALKSCVEKSNGITNWWN